MMVRTPSWEQKDYRSHVEAAIRQEQQRPNKRLSVSLVAIPVTDLYRAGRGERGPV